MTASVIIPRFEMAHAVDKPKQVPISLMCFRRPFLEAVPNGESLGLYSPSRLRKDSLKTHCSSVSVASLHLLNFGGHRRHRPPLQSQHMVRRVFQQPVGSVFRKGMGEWDIASADLVRDEGKNPRTEKIIHSES